MTIKLSAKNLIFFQIIYNCIIKFFIVDCHLPGAFNYVSDILLILTVYIIFKAHAGEIRIGNNVPLLFAGTFLLIGTFSALLSLDSSPVLYLWSFRNNIRLFIFFYCCYKTLEKEDVQKLLEIILKIFYINIAVCLFEYFIKGVEYDYLGGLFGNGVRGGNGPLNGLMIVAMTYLIIEYINKNKPAWELILGTCGALFIATVAELKFFYIELLLLVFLVCIFVTHNYRMLVFIASATIIGMIGMAFYIRLYPERAGFISVNFIREYSFKSTYGEFSRINRLTAIPTIWSNYFDYNIKKCLIGLGMGNGEMSSQFSFLNSLFYSKYGIYLRYDWFSQAFLFVETGLLGLLTYISFFVASAQKAWANKTKNNQVALITMFFMILTIFYNQALRVESFCYMAAFLAAIPFIEKGVQCQN